jgi:hypothetical protein
MALGEGMIEVRRVGKDLETRKQFLLNDCSGQKNNFFKEFFQFLIF